MSPEINVVAITSVASNKTSINVLQVLQVLKHHHNWHNTNIASHPSVAIGSHPPLSDSSSAHLETADPQGFTSMEVKKLLEIYPCKTDNNDEIFLQSKREPVEEILHVLSSSEPNTISIMAVGPLTNIARACKTNMEVMKRVSRIYVRGGCIKHPFPGGNITPCAESNFYVDPLSASIVLNSGLPVTLVPLDVSETCRLRYGVYNEYICPLVNKSPVPHLVSSLLNEIYKELDSDPSLPSNEELASDHDVIETVSLQHSIKSVSVAMHGPLCLGIILDPSIVKESKMMKIEVELDSPLTRGMCVTDGRRWKKILSLEEKRKSILKNASRPLRETQVVFRVDSNQFFKKFMKVSFGVEWDESNHQWTSFSE
jgi:inosine-uridine nucleoside N-ribohydrolase